MSVQWPTSIDQSFSAAKASAVCVMLFTPLRLGAYDWIGLRQNLQETIDFPIKYGGFPVDFPLNQSIEHSHFFWIEIISDHLLVNL